MCRRPFLGGSRGGGGLGRQTTWLVQQAVLRIGLDRCVRASYVNGTLSYSHSREELLHVRVHWVDGGGALSVVVRQAGAGGVVEGAHGVVGGLAVG